MLYYDGFSSSSSSSFSVFVCLTLFSREMVTNMKTKLYLFKREKRLKHIPREATEKQGGKDDVKARYRRPSLFAGGYVLRVSVE